MFGQSKSRKRLHEFRVFRGYKTTKNVIKFHIISQTTHIHNKK